jgi:hypothetical protein
VVRSSECQCRSCNNPGFNPCSILRHSRVQGAADEAVLNKVLKKTRTVSKNRFICHLSGSHVSEDVWDGTQKIIANFTLTVRASEQWATSTEYISVGYVVFVLLIFGGGRFLWSRDTSRMWRAQSRLHPPLRIQCTPNTLLPTPHFPPSYSPPPF